MSDTKQINVRLPLELHKALADHKIRTGEDKSEVIRRGVEHVLGVPTSYRATDVIERIVDVPKANGSKPETVEFAAWLAGKTGIPRALCRRRLSEKRITLDGEVCTDDRVPIGRLADKGAVKLDGRPL